MFNLADLMLEKAGNCRLKLGPRILLSVRGQEEPRIIDETLYSGAGPLVVEEYFPRPVLSEMLLAR